MLIKSCSVYGIQHLEKAGTHNVQQKVVEHTDGSVALQVEVMTGQTCALEAAARQAVLYCSVLLC